MPGRRREKKGPPAYPRTARVNEVLREVVAEALERMADTDDRLRLLTVTSVDITPDLSRATVYLSSLPPPAIEALAEQRTELQRTRPWRTGYAARRSSATCGPAPTVTTGRSDDVGTE